MTAPRPAPQPVRSVEVADLLEWLPRHAGEGPLVTSLPDAAEVGLSDVRWHEWFGEAASACFRASTGPTIFLATDRKRDGHWISKAHLIRAAAAGERRLLWHRIVLRRSPGAIDLVRPTYSHLLAFGPGRPGRARPDVIEPSVAFSRVSAGRVAALEVARYLAELHEELVLNPACGYGTFLAAANACGLDAYGCDISPERVEASREAVLAP